MQQIYFANSRAEVSDSSKWYQPKLSLTRKLERLIDESGTLDFIDKGDLVAVKTHFGERGATKYLRPVYVRKIVDAVRERGGKPFVTESTGLGMVKNRSTVVGRLITAEENGFTQQTVNAPIVVADGVKGFDYTEVDVDGKHLNRIKVAKAIADADAMVCATHFKLHMVAGMGGSIKNVGVGCVAKPSKFDIHCSDFPVINENCDECGDCLEVCPTNAIVDYQVVKERCIKCGGCDEVCKRDAIDITWLNGTPISERIAECAAGALKPIDKTAYLNFFLDVTPHCDCHPYADNPIVQDLGVFASNDMVAIDQACYDAFLNQNANPDTIVDSFWKDSDPLAQITHSQELGAGETQYKINNIA